VMPAKEGVVVPLGETVLAHRDCKALLEIATPELYRENAFRITGLPVTADEREIRHRAKMLRLTERFSPSTVQTTSGCLPLKPPPDGDAVKRAIGHLRKPETRLVHEFFWFWPSEWADSRDDALELLAKRRLREALSLWREREKGRSRGRVPTHNIAVLNHVCALHLEQRADTTELSEEADKRRWRYWRKAYSRWRRLRDDDTFWAHLAARVRDLADPRLTTGSVRRIRQSLDKALLAINARLAVRLAEKGDAATAEQHLRIMHQSGFDQSAICETLRESLSHIRVRIKAAVDQASTETTTGPATGGKATRALFNDATPLLRVLDVVLRSDDALRLSLHDEVARTALDCAGAYGAAEENWAEVAELLETTQRLAAGESLRERVKEAQDTVQSILGSQRRQAELKQAMATGKVYDVTVPVGEARVPGCCACCLGPADVFQHVSYSWEERKGLVKSRRSVSFRFPLCSSCEEHREELPRRRMHLVVLTCVISLVAIGLIGLVVGRLSYLAFMGVAVLITGVTFGFLSTAIRVAALDDSHASRGSAVAIRGVSSGGITFRFWNTLYADAFAQANGAAAVPAKAWNYSRAQFLTEGLAGLQVVLASLALCALAHSIAYSLLSDHWDAAANRRAPKRSSSANAKSGARQPRVTPSPSRRSAAPGAGEFSSLASQIADGRRKIAAMESDFVWLEAQLDVLRSRLDASKRVLESYESRAKQGLPVDLPAYEAEIEKHNATVQEHNQLLTSLQSKFSTYEKETERVNDMVRRYNNGLR